jgi:hypothetical protein
MGSARRVGDWQPVAAIGAWVNPGALDAGLWLTQRALTPPSVLRWHVEIALDVVDAPTQPEFDETRATRFHLDIYSEEWGVFFCHHGKSSWIRMTDIAFVHGRDDFSLLGVVPPLKDIGAFLRRLEAAHGIRFRREHALVRSNVPSAERTVRDWVATL